MTLLPTILESKLRDIDALCRTRPPAAPLNQLGARVDVAVALRRARGGRLNLIAEVKLRSPSAGALSHALAPGERAVAYAEAGASMVSILCDGPFFEGSWDHVAAARRGLDAAGWGVPVLAKEFVLHERQILEAARRGASAVLLIARIVSPARLLELAASARAEGLEPVFEVVDQTELDATLAADGRVIGVNARDLDTLAMDLTRAARVLAAIPENLVGVHLSGIRGPDDVARVSDGRADAALIGEALMRDDDPRPRLRAMVDAADSNRTALNFVPRAPFP